MFLGNNSEHLCLYCLHLFIQLLETHHLAPVLMYLSLQQMVTHLNKRCVNIEGLMPSGQELAEFIITILLDSGIIVPWSCVNLPHLVGLSNVSLLKV